MNRWVSWLTLFTSTGTLICCALPSLLVSLGLGAVMVGLVSSVPQIVWLSQYKAWVFSISGLLILGSFCLQHQEKNRPCPIDQDLAAACQTSRRYARWILWVSASLWLVGAFFAFVAIYL